jgi:putative photosynthetic complex assembly protein 2
MTLVLDMALPALFVIFVWWSSTGLVFALNGRPDSTYATSLAIVAMLGVGALIVLWLTAAGTTRLDASLALVATIVVWGTIEMSFLMGFVTGPNARPCPLGCSEWQRFVAACGAIAYHEAALVAALGLVWWLTMDASNSVGVTAFALLWLMRLSTKLNLFLGVPNTAAELLPARIAHLASYFRRTPMSPFFPLSVTLATIAAAVLTQRAMAAPAGSAECYAAAILAVLAALGAIEHWFLVLPIKPETLWGWSLNTKDITHGSAAKKPRDPLLPRAEAQI